MHTFLKCSTRFWKVVWRAWNGCDCCVDGTFWRILEWYLVNLECKGVCNGDIYEWCCILRCICLEFASVPHTQTSMYTTLVRCFGVCIVKAIVWKELPGGYSTKVWLSYYWLLANSYSSCMHIYIHKLTCCNVIHVGTMSVHFLYSVK